MRSTRFLKQVRLVCAAAGLVVAAGAAQASTIFFEDFNGYTSGNPSATQPGTGLTLSYGGSLSGWTNSGFNTAHAVNFGAGDYAVSLYDNNVITMASGILAAAAGQSYVVSFDAGASVYGGLSQATQAGDGLVINVLRADNTVLASQTIQPGAWVDGLNAQALSHYAFTYTGDGSGAVRLQIGTNTAGTDRFGGAIDNLSVSTGAVPEPGTLALALLGIVGVGASRVRVPAKAKRKA